MKKTLLLLVAAVGLGMTAQAQVAEVPVKKGGGEKIVTAVAPISVETSVDEMQQVAPNINGPKRSVANGVWYQRPAGTFLATGSSYRYIYVPPFTKLTWTNMYATDPAAAVWAYGATAQNPYDASLIVDNNLVNKYNKHVGTGASYGPFLYVEGVDTFAIIDSQLSTGFPLVIAPDTINTFMQIPATVNYSGFSSFSYGTNPVASAARGDGTDTYTVGPFFEYYRAPAQPFYFEGITLYARMPDGKTVPVEEGSEGVTCYVLSGEDPTVGDLSTFTDTVAVIPINPTYAEIADYREGYLTTIKAYCMKEDEFGDMVQMPAILDKAFVLVFEGFTNEGVDFTVNMSRVPVEEMYYNGGPYATVYHHYWSDGTRKGSYYQYNATNGSQYNMQIRLNGMWDVVSLYDDENTKYTAPVEGGDVVDAEDYAGIYIQTVHPYQSEMSPEPSYQVQDMPEWLTISSYNDNYYTSNYGWVTIVNFTAEPLPVGVEGRKATLRFVSEMGGKSQEFTIIQGDEEAAGINGVTVEEEVTGIKRGTFNLAGQRVGKDYKGIVIENGKKIIRK